MARERENAHTSGGKLDRQRNRIGTTADLGDDRCVPVIGRETAADFPRSLGKEGGRSICYRMSRREKQIAAIFDNFGEGIPTIEYVDGSKAGSCAFFR